MKIAVLSDIHSNIYALRAVMDDVLCRKVDAMFNLGDILYGPIAPQETFEYLQQFDFITIAGNQDRQIFDASQKDIDANPTLKFIFDDLNDQAVAWMRALPKDRQFSKEVYCCHGTPTSDLIYLLEDVQSGQPQLRPEQEISEYLAGQKSEIILCGHTHIPRVVQLQTGQTIVNPGSVGLPAYSDELPCQHMMETYSSMASYAILEKTAAQKWKVELVKVPYDVAPAVDLALSHGREDWAFALSSGRAV
ncbi:metallophosphoesterase family protein [Agarilytica rhodophyticola]|uniref:metallophosphoesterase family protein n=1 Tax=Agarilytica rhodophyticola TaxID=1737490 RepID=UPI000B348F2B|nr:metallophosphoesterase family protein [Agarilytica rhodophyticola]